MAIAFCLASSQVLVAQQFFTEADDPFLYYDSGLVFQTAPSQVIAAGTTGDKFPISGRALVDDHALSLTYASRTGGDWSAFVIAPGFRSWDLSLTDSLGFWIYSEQEIAPAELPRVGLESATGNLKTATYPLANFLSAGRLLPNRWQLVSISLESMRRDAANASFNFTRTKAVMFTQADASQDSHSLLIDEVIAYNASSNERGNPAGTAQLEAYPAHRELTLFSGQNVPDYYALVADDGSPLKLITPSTDTLAQIWTPTSETAGRHTTYTPGYGFGSASNVISIPALADDSDEVLFDMVQRYSLRYAWDFAHPISGLTRERRSSGNTVTIGGSGFGIMAWMVGVHRGWLTREQVVDRLNTTLVFLEQADRFHGVWPHWMDGRTGRTIPFSQFDDGGDLVETAFMAEALLTARNFFDANNPQEDSIRTRCTRLWEAIEWDWFQRPGEDVLTWHWSPVNQWAIDLKIRGFNEAQIIYLLAAMSPTHPVAADVYDTGWTGPNYRTFQGNYGIFIQVGQPWGGPMFFAHYSYLGFDPRYWADEFINYFDRNRAHALYQVAYAADNPGNFAGYSANCWGLTASDDPGGYSVHAATLAEDNGTVTPTAALASMPYVPDEALDALRYFYFQRGPELLGDMGFYDAFNLSDEWMTREYLAIDQMPIVGMIENHRSALLWDAFSKNDRLATTLTTLGFRPDTAAAPSAVQVLAKAEKLSIYPNPVVDELSIALPADWTSGDTLSIALFTSSGGIAFRQNRIRSAIGVIKLDVTDLPVGPYLLLLTQGGQTGYARVLITH